MHILPILTGMSLLLSSQMFSTDRFFNQPIASIKNNRVLDNLEKILQLKDLDDDEFVTSFELLFDLLMDTLPLSKEDKTKFIFFFLSDLEGRKKIKERYEKANVSLKIINPDGKSPKFLIDSIEPNLLKQYVIPLATSLNLDIEIVENYIDEQKFIECFAYLLFI